MTAIIEKEWIDTDGLFAGQVLKNRRIGQCNERTLIALRAFDAGLLANSRHPFVGTGWAVP